jgi:hypothetical protein
VDTADPVVRGVLKLLFVFQQSFLCAVQATDVIWKVLVCLTLFSLANFLKSVLTKLLSSHFYKYVSRPGPCVYVVQSSA